MKVLHLLPSLDPAAGGVNQAVRTIIAGLQPAGVQNEVACVDPPDAAFLQSLSFPVYALGPGKTAWGHSPLLRPWLQTHLPQYDAVIVHGLWQYQTYAAYKAFQKTKEKPPKLFVMPHGMLDPYFQQAKGRKMKAIRNWFFWKAIESKLVNTADGLLFTCETEKLLARQPFTPYHPKQEWVVGLGIEPPPAYEIAMQQTFQKKLPGISLPLHWLYISRIHEKKGVDLLVQAYRHLIAQGHTLPPLVIAGPGLETLYGKQIQQMAEGYSIYFTGMLTGNAKWGAFYGCEAFILPSHQENFGIAVVEALACGKPVLISDQVNIWREITTEGSGFAVPDTLPGVIQLLNGWLNKNDKQKREAVAAAPSTYNKYFSLPSVSQKLLAALS